MNHLINRAVVWGLRVLLVKWAVVEGGNLAWAQEAVSAVDEDRPASLKDVLRRLEPISLNEAALRKIAGKDRFAPPYVLNPVLATGSSTRKAWGAGALGSPCVGSGLI
jgi:hypothetical protein